MNKTDKLVSAYAFKKAFNYALKQGVSAVDLLLDHEIIGALIHHENSWATESAWKRFINAVAKHTKQNLYTTGRSVQLTSEFDSFQLGLLRILPIKVITKFLPRHFRDTIHKGLRLSVESFCSKKRQLIICQYADNPESYGVEFCDYNRGAFDGILYSKGYRGVAVHEPKCILKGDSHCMYSICWARHTPVPYFKIIADFVRVFLKKRDRIQDYVWEAIPHEGRPVSADDLKNLFEEDE